MNSIRFIWKFLFGAKIKENDAKSIESILVRILSYLMNSDDSIWSDMDVGDTKKVIEKQIINLKKNQKINVSKLYYLFLPTAPLQEISMANGWVDEYMKLAEEFDKYIKVYS